MSPGLIFLVVGSTSVTSDECSARTCVILIWGPSGVTVPPLPTRIPCSAADPAEVDHRLDESGGVARTVGPSDRPEVIGVAMGDDDHVDRQRECGGS